MPPLPPIGLPLPEIGLPLPPTGLPAPQKTKPTEAKRPPRARHGGRTQVLPIYVFPTYAIPPIEPKVEPAPTVAAPANGTLSVRTNPRVDGQVYVDGSYVGATDASWEDLSLDAGLHTIEVRADGFETLVDSVLVAGGRAVTYAAPMKPLPKSAPLPASESAHPRPPATLYVIPGCYAGNVPPDQVGLPAGCDPGRAVIVNR